MIDISFLIQHLKDKKMLNVSNLKSQMSKLSPSLVSDLTTEDYGGIITLYLLSPNLVETFGGRFRFHTFEGVEKYLQMNLLDWLYVISSQSHEMVNNKKCEDVREAVKYLNNFYKFALTITMVNGENGDRNEKDVFKAIPSSFCLN